MNKSTPGLPDHSFMRRFLLMKMQMQAYSKRAVLHTALVKPAKTQQDGHLARLFNSIDAFSAAKSTRKSNGRKALVLLLAALVFPAAAQGKVIFSCTDQRGKQILVTEQNDRFRYRYGKNARPNCALKTTARKQSPARRVGTATGAARGLIWLWKTATTVIPSTPASTDSRAGDAPYPG